MTAYTLRPYQELCLEKIREAVDAGTRRMLAVLATGAGKTVIFSHLPSTLQLGNKMMVLAHREELLDQAAAKISQVNPSLRVDIEQGQRRASHRADVVIASVATIGRRGSPRLVRWQPSDFGAIVTDEAHHSVAASYLNVYEHFGILDLERKPDGEIRKILPPSSPNHPLLLGVTATPERGDEVGLGAVYEHVVFEKHLKELVKEGYLSHIRAWKISSETDLSGIHSRAGDYVASELSAAVNTPYRNALAVRSYQELATGLPALVFCVDVQHAADMASAFLEAGIPTEAIVGEMGPEQRKATLARFASGETRVLTNVMVLTEGFDAPWVQCLVMARPTQSPSLYMQILGRGTRLCEGKDFLRVIDLADNTRHRPTNCASLLGLPPNWETQGKDILEEAEHVEQLELNREVFDKAVSLEHARRLMREVNILDGIEEARKHLQTRFSWIPLHDGSFCLSLPLETGAMVWFVRPDLIGRWHIDRREHSGQVVRIGMDFESAEKAAAMADRFIDRIYPRAASLVDQNAAWRARAASSKQRDLLSKWGLWREGLTSAQASDLISRRIMQRQVAK